MTHLDLVTDANCNIFTDASFKEHPVILGEPYITTVTSPGANFYSPNLQILDSVTNIVHQSTVPRGEIMAIYHGLELGYRHVLPGQTINIFSDSLISVKGVREWIFNWINNQHEGFLYGYDGSLVKNQMYFLGIVYMVLRHNIPVRFYHVKGHLSYLKQKDRKQFCHSFMTQNRMTVFPTELFLTYLMRGNAIIDDTVRNILSPDNIQRTAEYWYNNVYNPLDIMKVANNDQFVRSLDMRRYRQLIGG